MKYKKISGNGSTTFIAVCYRCKKDLKHVGSLSQKYCSECKKIVDREKSRDRMRRYRERQKQN